MFADRYTAVIDANVLAPALERNLLLSLAEEGFFRPRWSIAILDETEKALLKILQRRGDNDAAAEARKQRLRIEAAFEEAAIDGYENLIEGLCLPDENDRHVLAAAIKARAAVIVTHNLADFPSKELQKFETEALTPDNFLANTIDLYAHDSARAIRKMRMRFNNPVITPSGLLLSMERAGLIDTAALLAEFEPDL